MESSEAKRIGRNYIKNFEKLGRIGLLLYGDVGTGKTFLAACIANALLNQGVSVKWLTSMQIVERSCFYSESEYAEYIRSITAPRSSMIWERNVVQILHWSVFTAL